MVDLVERSGITLGTMSSSVTESSQNPPIWEPQRLPEKQTVHWHCGALELLVRRQGCDWLAQSVQHPQDDHQEKLVRFTDDEAGIQGAQRWAFDRPLDNFVVRPGMPDRPVVVRPYDPLFLPKGCEVVFYVSIPLWMELCVVDGKQVIPLRKYPSLVVTSIWFGDPMSGVLCYSLKSRALRNLSGVVPAAHRATCPVTIRNSCDESLPIEKFCLHVAHLGVYEGGDRHWAQPVLLHNFDKAKPSRIEYGNQAPKEAPNPKLLAEPAEKPQQGLMARTFRSEAIRFF